MTPTIQVRVDCSDFIRQVGNLKTTVRNKGLRKGVTAGAQAFTKESKSLCPIRDMGHALNTASVGGRFTLMSIRHAGTDKEKIVETTYKGGLLQKSIGYKVKTYRGSGCVVAICGPRSGFRQQIGSVIRGPHAGQPVYADPRKYAHLAKNGTRHAAPHDFMTAPARTASQVMNSGISASLDAAIAEAAKS